VHDEALTWRAVLPLLLMAISWAALAPAASTQEAKTQPAGNLGQPPVTTASAPEEHFRLAEYFRELASQEQALAEPYNRLAKIYRGKRASLGLRRCVGPRNEEPVQAPRRDRTESCRSGRKDCGAACAAGRVGDAHPRSSANQPCQTRRLALPALRSKPAPPVRSAKIESSGCP
jgi:hypothetical protein